MNTSFERSANASDEWYTPREIIEALGEFDLDPCAPMHPLWPTAKISPMFDGLIKLMKKNGVSVPEAEEEQTEDKKE